MANAYITHSLPGRVRFRIPSHIRDAAYFSTAAEALLEIPGVESVKANPVAGSILLLHHREPNELVAEIARRGWFTVVPGAPPLASPSEARPLEARLAAGLEEAQRRWHESTGGLDFNRPMVAGLVVAGVVQVLRGRWLPSGFTLAASAAGLSWLARKHG